MTELVITIATLSIIIMAWSKISKALDWTGNRIGQATDVVDHVFDAGTRQTARAVIISDKALDDTKLERIKAKKTWIDEHNEATKDLSKPQQTRVAELEDWMNNL